MSRAKLHLLLKERKLMVLSSDTIKGKELNIHKMIICPKGEQFLLFFIIQNSSHLEPVSIVL